MPFRVPRGLLLVACSLAVSACGPPYSTLVVHNRTAAAISFVNIRSEALFVAPCTSETFRWEGGWIDDTPLEPVAGAREVQIVLAPPPDGIDHFTVIVGDTRVLYARAEASLPACD